MKLFIDDHKVCPEGWEVARTIAEAIRILDTQPVDVISLDHDIMYVHTETGQMATQETFEPVARFIRARGLNVYAGMDETPVAPMCDFLRVWIHTGNPGGGENMAKILGLDYQKCMAAVTTLNRFEQHYHGEKKVS